MNDLLRDLAEVMRTFDAGRDVSIDLALAFAIRHHAAIEQAVRDAAKTRAFRNRLVSERVSCYSPYHGYEAARALAEADVNAFEDAFDAAMAQEKADGYNQDSPPDTDPQSIHREAYYAGMADGPEPDGD